MKKISFLILLFLMVGCSTPEIHIPSYNLDGDSNNTNNVSPEEATSEVTAIDKEKNKIIPLDTNKTIIATEKFVAESADENNISQKKDIPIVEETLPSFEPTTIESQSKEVPSISVINIMSSDEEDSPVVKKIGKAKTKKIQDAPKIETKGGFFSLFGKKQKVRNEYFTGGKLRSKFVMSDDTGESGLLYKYGYDGKVTSTVYIKHGLKNGLETLFDEEGRIMKRTPYVDGRKDGIVEVYYPDGKVLAQITYANNKRHGRASKYNHDGTVNEEVQYINGRVESISTESDEIEIPIID
jgi:antitoxin component YwqK of YwqJK toxin-antitoxin module